MLWDYLSSENKKDIKSKLVSVLIDKSEVLRRAAANAIASVAAIEIQRGEWLDLIDNLNKNTQNTDAITRKTSTTILGFICEQLNQTNCNVPESIQEKLLTGVLSSLKHSTEVSIMQVALKALLDAIPFLSNLVSKAEVANYIFNTIAEGVKANPQ